MFAVARPGSSLAKQPPPLGLVLQSESFPCASGNGNVEWLSLGMPRVSKRSLLLIVIAPLYAQSSAGPPDPFPLSQRFSHYLYRTYSWQRMAWLGFDTGFDFGLAGAPGLNDLMESYGDGFGRRIVRNSAEFAAGALLHEDARYRGLYQGSYVRRLRHATIRAFQASVPGGGYRPAYSRFAAIAVGELVAPVWCTAGAPGPRVLPSIGFGILGQVENNYLSEFTPELTRFGRKVGNKLRHVVTVGGVRRDR